MLLKKIIPSCDSISSWQVPLFGPFPQPLHSWAQLCRRCLPGQFLPSLLSHAPELLPITAPRDSLWNEGKNLRDGLAILKCHFCKGTQSRTALKNAQHPAWDQLLKAEMSNSAHRESFEGPGNFSRIIQAFSSENSGKWGQISWVNTLMQCSNSWVSSGQITARVAHSQNW